MPAVPYRVRVLLVALVAAGVGAAAGALLPGVIERVPAGRPVLGPLTRPRARHLVPIGAGAAVCALLALAADPGAARPAYVYLGCVGLALAGIDLGCRRLPDALTLPSYPIAAVLLGVAALDGAGGRALRAIAGMALLGAGYFVLAALRPGGLGVGDVKLSGVLGLYLGWAGWSALLLGTLAAFTAGALVGLTLVAAGRATMTTALPFGPFMLAGALLGLTTA